MMCINLQIKHIVYSLLCRFASHLGSVRKDPDSYSSLDYYNYATYTFTPSEGDQQLARFRIVPVEAPEGPESGALDETEKHENW